MASAAFPPPRSVLPASGDPTSLSFKMASLHHWRSSFVTGCAKRSRQQSRRDLEAARKSHLAVRRITLYPSVASALVSYQRHCDDHRHLLLIRAGISTGLIGARGAELSSRVTDPARAQTRGFQSPYKFRSILIIHEATVPALPLQASAKTHQHPFMDDYDMDRCGVTTTASV